MVYVQAFSTCGEQGLLFVTMLGLLFAAMHGLLIAVASLAECGFWGTQASGVVAHGLRICSSWALEHDLSSCGTQAYLPCSMWNLLRPGIKLISSALADRFLTTGPPRKSKS